MTAIDLAILTDLSRRVIFFPVRHHSPTAARLVRTVIQQLRPAVILIECPVDFNDRLDELHLPHQLPIAIYSYLRLANGNRYGAFYPLCEHSPEWQAIRAAHESGTAVRFIDLPWADIATTDEEPTSNRFTDGLFRRSTYIRQLCARLGVDDFDTLWDTLFEIDPQLDVSTYLVRAHHLCASMRLLDGPGRRSDRQREAFMASQVRDALMRSTGQVVVVVGGAHCLPLAARVDGIDLGEWTQPADHAPQAVQPDEERGIALTPYSFERLDNLAGYEAGMPNPGFYQRLYEDRREGRPGTHHALLEKVVTRLRQSKQALSAADLIAAEATAEALARLRGHAVVWRTDLVDGLTSALIKDDVGRNGRHPLLEAIHEVLRGGQRGRLAAGAVLPPLVRDIQARLDEQDLVPTGRPRELELVLDEEADRPRSQVLHQLRLLEVPGFERVAGTDLVRREEMGRVWERWRLNWSPDFSARCIEAARYGVTLADAAAAVLAEQAAPAERSTADVAILLLDAGLAGLVELAVEMRQRVAERIRTGSDFLDLSQALEHLLYLYRYDHVLLMGDNATLGVLLQDAYHRALWLFEGLGQRGGDQAGVVHGVVALRETFERCARSLDLSREELLAVLGRVGGDRAQADTVRGAALGAQWSLGATDGTGVRGQMRGFTAAERLGDFLVGLFALAREQVQRHRDLLLAIHETIVSWPEDDFLQALPALRLAFTYFTPREKHHLGLTLRQALGLEKEQAMTALTVDVDTAARALAREGRLLAAAARYGLRGGRS